MNIRSEAGIKRAIVVCGPTAAGKSGLADYIAASLSAEWGGRVPTLVVDSMQVYREIPRTTNQRRERPAELVGIVSVEQEWTVALHKERAQGLIDGLADGFPFVLDAGTGMYLNALILGIPLAPKVPAPLRELASKAAEGAVNPRRAAREEELRLSGASERGSVWSGRLRYGASFVYLRPPRERLDARIPARSADIVRHGVEEGRTLLGLNPTPSVSRAVGPKEMMELASGSTTAEEAERAINARTRRLARRQMRWFDKLVKTLPETATRAVVETPEDPRIKHIMHDTMRSWA